MNKLAKSIRETVLFIFFLMVFLFSGYHVLNYFKIIPSGILPLPFLP